MNQTLRAELRELLQQRIVELAAGSTSDDERSEAIELDQARVGRLARMDAMQQQSMFVATRIRNQRQLARLQQALVRIDSHDCGYCDACGEPVAQGRLRIAPAARLSIGCAGRT